MQALILAGGKGTRLRPLTLYTPKPVVPVMNRPFLLYQIEVLAAAGVRDITLSLNYQPDKIEDVLGDGAEHGVHLRYLTEPSPLGTAGAYKYAEKAIRETTVVMNGDILTDIDLSGMLAAHRADNSDATIALAPVADPSAYGLVETGLRGEIKRFLEKPDRETIGKLRVNTVNSGIYVLEPSILDLIPRGESVSFEYDIFPALLEKKLRFHSFVMNDSYWRDIGNPASYLAAHMDSLSGKFRHTVRNERSVAEVATSADVDPISVLGEGCTIKPSARVSKAVLGPGVFLEERAVIENSVVWAHTRIATGAEIRGAVIGRSGYIGRNALVREGAVLGDKATIPDYSRV